MRIRTALAVVALATTAVLSAHTPVERSILVTVVTKDGAPLKDLTPPDFVVVEDGQPRTVTSAALSNEPMAIALMIDTSKPPIGTDLPVRDIRAGLNAFVKTIYAANPESKISLTDISGAAVKTVNFTNNGDQMLKATGRVVVGQRSSGVLIEGLIDTAKDMNKVTATRRAIVVLSFDAPEASTTQPRDAAMAVQKSGAAFWAVTIGSGGSPVREVIFDNLPATTGGMRLTALQGTGLEKMLTNVAESLTTQYLVTYTRPDDGKAETIQAGAHKGDKVLRANWVR